MSDRVLSRGVFHILYFPQVDEADAGDGLDFAEGLDGGGGVGGVLDVDLDDGEGLALGDALGAGGAAEGEVGDVDGVLAEDGADADDDAGDVVVADGEECAVERRLDVDAVVGEQAGRVAVEDGGGGADITGISPGRSA